MDDVRLIDANAIVEKLKRYYEALSPDVQSELIRRDEVSSCIAELINAPTIDAQPVKHGKWVPMDEYCAKCSVCGWWQKTNGKCCAGNAYIHRVAYKYCTSCGAKMDGDAE